MSRLDKSVLKNSDSVEILEGYLHNHLRPVDPDPDFISNLFKRLTTSPSVLVERRTQMNAYLVISFGLLFGVLLFWLIRRLKRLI